MSNMTNPNDKCKPAITKTIEGCSVNLFFATEDNPSVILLTKGILTTSYAKKLLSEKDGATLVDK